MARSKVKPAAAASEAVAGPRALPAGWEWKRLGAILPLTYGKALVASDRFEGGSVPVYGSAGISGRHSTWLCNEPAIIVGRKGSAGSVYHSLTESFPIDTAYYCPASQASVDLRLAFFLLTSLNLRKLDQSTAVPSLGRDIYNDLIVPVPRPEAQAPLAKRIDELFAEVEDGEAALERARGDLATWRKALLKAAVTGELTADWRAANPPTETGADLLARILAERRTRWLAEPRNKGKRYVEPEATAPTQMAELPSGWARTTLGAIFDVFVGSTPPRAEKEYWGGDIPWVSSGEVSFCRIRSTRETITRSALRRSEKRLHPPGTVMLGMIGEGKTRGQAAILDVWAAHNQNCASIRVSETAVVPEFVYAFLRERYEETRVGSSGGNQPALNKARIESFAMPLPSITEQHHIIACIELAEDAWDSEILDYDVGATLRQSILAAAFRGELVR